LIALPTPENIARAVTLLQQGKLVAFATETVYGLGGDATNPRAVAAIFAAKGRPQDHPVIVHLADAAQVDEWAVEIPETARKLAARFWPGPLTMILRRAPHVGDAVTGGQNSVGLRVPSHPVAQQLLRAFGKGVAAPSANRFGRVSPTTAAHVAAEFGEQGTVDLILDGGACEVGIESTIVDLSRGGCVVLRPGRIGAAELAHVIGTGVDTTPQYDDAPRAPGMLEAHYAPNTPLRVLARDALLLEAKEGDAVLAFAATAAGTQNAHWIVAAPDAIAYAHDLYANLRKLDALKCQRMLIEQPPAGDAWTAILDRLGRAQTSLT
jgi:L-threonylcarbamoyladenylate synthase